MKERTKLIIILLAFLGAYYIPWSSPIIRQSGLEAFMMLQEYAREHVLTCLIPAFFIAGAIAVFVSQASVLKYFGATARKILSYSVASVSGTVLAVCSCTVLPLFAGIYCRGRASALQPLFSIQGRRSMSWPLCSRPGFLAGNWAWQGLGAVFFAIITGVLMAFIFRKDDAHARQDRCTFRTRKKRGGPSRRTRSSCSPWSSSSSLPPLPGPPRGRPGYGLPFLPPNGSLPPLSWLVSL
jgi:uncharacterized protein